MIVSYTDSPLFIWGLSYNLGQFQHELSDLKSNNLLIGSVETLTQMGYRRCLAVAEQESVADIAAPVVKKALAHADGGPQAFFFQYGNVESTVSPWDAGEPDGSTRHRFTPAVVMDAVGQRDVPYFCSFASGCAGFSLLLASAGSMLRVSRDTPPAVCVMADIKPPNGYYDMFRERILGSDHSSAFVLGREQLGFQVLGVNCYSTARTVVPLLEIVKRTAQMIKELAAAAGIDLSDPHLLVHYPNTFPDTWTMVTRTLRLKPEQQVLIDMPERAHCGASDSVISLEKMHRGQPGRIHVVVTYGSGLHLAVSLLKEQEHLGFDEGNQSDFNLLDGER